MRGDAGIREKKEKIMTRASAYKTSRAGQTGGRGRRCTGGPHGVLVLSITALLTAIIASLIPSRLLAVDVDPKLLGSWPEFLRGPATDVAIAGNYA